MPRHYKPAPPRPASLTARCGHEVAVKKTGKLPEWCIACRAARAAAARARIIVAQVDMAALPASDAKLTSDVLRAAGERASYHYRRRQEKP